MVKLFENDEVTGLPKFTTEARTLEPFKNVISRSSGKGGRPNNQLGLKEMAYIYWFAKFDTHYDQFDEHSKKIEIKKAVGLEKEWTPDKYVLEAIEFFLKTQRTKTMKHLEAVEESVNKLSDYLKNANPDERIESGPKKGELVHDLNKIKNLAKEMPELIESIQKSKDLVYKEMQEETANRAGRKTNKYNE